MRKVQIEIKLTDIGEEPWNEKEKISVYADGENIWEVICAGMDELLKVAQESRPLPMLGCKEHY